LRYIVIQLSIHLSLTMECVIGLTVQGELQMMLLLLLLHVVYLQRIQVMFVYEGHRVDVKVTGAVLYYCNTVGWTW